MKKTSKILLSALAVFSMFFTMTVNAEEQALTTPQEETQVQETLKDITSTDLNTIFALIGDNISISRKESELDFENLGLDNDPVYLEIKEKLETKLNSEGWDTTHGKEVYVYYDTKNDNEYDIHKVIVGVGPYTETITVNINYSNSSQFNTTDETYVKNIVNNIKFIKYNDSDTVFKMYDVNAESTADAMNYDFSKIVNDSSITIKSAPYSARGGDRNGVIGIFGYNLFFYKNDVLYATKEVKLVSAFGTILNNATPVIMDKIYDTEEIYKEMVKEFENKGYTNILGAYDLTAYGTTYDNMKVSFNLGSNNNGKEVIILHKKKDNTYETFTTTVADGKAEITVSEFSPFMIALSNNNTTTENVNKAPNNAQTSSIDIVLYSILALGSLVGITYILISKKKKEIA